MRSDIDIWGGEPSALASSEFFSSPFGALRRMEREMNRMFDGILRSPLSRTEMPGGVSFVPTCDLEEGDNCYLVSFDLPGTKKEDVNVEVCGNRLIVSGERKREQKEEREGRYFAEREYGKFCRSFSLPSDVKPEEVQANYENGVLQIAIPKTERAKPKTIPIGEGQSEKLIGKGKQTKAA